MGELYGVSRKNAVFLWVKSPKYIVGSLRGTKSLFRKNLPLAKGRDKKESPREAKPLLRILPPLLFKERGIKGVRFLENLNSNDLCCWR